MKTTIGLALAAALAASPFATFADDAARGPGTGHPCREGRGMRGGRGARLYDAKTVTTVSGQVAAVESGPRGRGVHLQLDTGSGTLPVHVGPAWFLSEQGLSIAAGDGHEITGSQITFDGKPALIAQAVKKVDKALALRDMQGIPVWAGQGQAHRK